MANDTPYVSRSYPLTAIQYLYLFFYLLHGKLKSLLVCVPRQGDHKKDHEKSHRFSCHSFQLYGLLTHVSETKFKLSLVMWLCVDCRTSTQESEWLHSAAEMEGTNHHRRPGAGRWLHDSVSRHCSHRLRMSDGRRGTQL